jgi:small subunit ribosomal protein S1
MDWTNRNIHPNKVCHVGDEIEVMVLDVDSERRRVSLGIKQCKANPWEEFAAIHKKGDQISGQIKSITDFGVFIGLEGGIDGLIHLSDLSWDESGEDVARNYNKGDEVTAIVLAVDADRERISLGLKQAQQDPFLSFVSENPKGSIVSGTIVSVDAKAAVIKLVEGVEGMLRATELSRDYVEDARMSLKEGESVESKITSIERKDRRITLSIKALDLDLENQAIKDYGTQTSATTSLGEKLKEQLEKAPESS